MATHFASPYAGASILKHEPLWKRRSAPSSYCMAGAIRERHPHARAELRLPGVGFLAAGA